MFRMGNSQKNNSSMREQVEFKVRKKRGFLGAWYSNVGTLLLVSPFFLIPMLYIIGIIMFLFYEIFTVDQLWYYLWFVVGLSSFIFLFGVFFKLFLAPYFAVTDPVWYTRCNKPIDFFRKYLFVPYFFNISLAAIAVFCTVFLALAIRDMGVINYERKVIGFINLVLLVCSVLLLPFVNRYTRWLKMKAIRTVANCQLCFECGYDLQGNPEGTHCPECGAKVMQVDEMRIFKLRKRC